MDEHEHSKDKHKTTCISPDLRKAQSDIARGLKYDYTFYEQRDLYTGRKYLNMHVA